MLNKKDIVPVSLLYIYMLCVQYNFSRLLQHSKFWYFMRFHRNK